MMRKTKIVIPFETIPESDVPIVKFYLDDKPRYAILDSGAESTLFDKSISHLLHFMKSEEVSIVGVSGETERANIDIVETKMWMQDSTRQIGILNVHGYINSLSHISEHFLGPDSDKTISAILGSDMLNHFDATMDFIKHEVTFSL